jgi:hypothetical protein
MMRSQARVTTDRASRYLQQLCKHFAHKLPTSHTAEAGRIEFGVGVCTLAAELETLVMTAESPDAASLDRLEDVIARHLVRFAFREPPEITWVRA